MQRCGQASGTGLTTGSDTRATQLLWLHGLHSPPSSAKAQINDCSHRQRPHRSDLTAPPELSLLKLAASIEKSAGIRHELSAWCFRAAFLDLYFRTQIVELLRRR